MNRRLASPSRAPARAMCSTPHDRLVAAAGLAAPPLPAAVDAAVRAMPLAEPTTLQDALTDHLATHGDAGSALVAGTLDRRLVLIKRRRTGERDACSWVVADLSGQAHRTRVWPAWASPHITLDRPRSWLSPATIDDQAVHRLTRPRVLLAALYHPEYFPLPRFPLAISDLARSPRATLLGQVRLLDMQLGITLDDIITAVATLRPDILGISATFGQHDLLVRLLDTVTAPPAPPLLVAGGSLVARNERLLLDRYPGLLVARGAGEATIADLLAHWHGDLDRAQIRGIGYTGAAHRTGTGTSTFTIGVGPPRSFRHTPTVGNRLQTDILPELDLLETTFQQHGVAQLESPRLHQLLLVLPPLPQGPVGRRRARRAEADAGRDGPGVPPPPGGLPHDLPGRRGVHRPRPWRHRPRARHRPHPAPGRLPLGDKLPHRPGGPRPDRDRGWHADRAELWRELCRLGLRRCLFGVESGVDSILERFNKETTAEQNALAIRTLSALGVPTRFTYITFDHLMTKAELHASHAFQGRTDLLLAPQPHLPAEAIVEGVRDPAFVAAHATGRPLYTAISYPLVSMECLIGAAYTRKVQAAGLAGTLRASMGRQDARFADWRIGRCSEWAQRWVDRNFALDYTLKSLEKLLDGAAREVVRGTRVVLKDAAYRVLGAMLDLIAAVPPAIDDDQTAAMDARLHQMLDAELTLLREALTGPCLRLQAMLPAEHATLLHREFERWARSAADGWTLINAADPCGT